ncbi:DUF4917 family protein [Leeia oryzae]|uniref:DUF4917 family protein n=1 Tax=Leeia oryzae TaxID=356662 RepID=UPI000367E373|nr:DUF4917 family protein [Leeia oryzae]
MPDILQWEEIKSDYQNGALILGNGASIAVHPKFGYPSLREAATESKALSPSVDGIFEAFGTDDFELVLRRLWQATLVNQALQVEPGAVEHAYREVRAALITTVRNIHISHNDALHHFEPIYSFMKDFRTVLSLNYDLVVYWSMLAGNHSLGQWFKDGFLRGDFIEDWKKLRKPYRADDATLVFYPHGNLITARQANQTELKLSADEDSLLARILEAWESENVVPLFVCEGTSMDKRRSINSSNYLSRVFREVIPNVEPTLVIYGWSMSDHDQHILDQLKHARLRRIAVSIYQNNEDDAKRIRAKLTRLQMPEPVFFDAESPGCWIHAAQEEAA